MTCVCELSYIDECMFPLKSLLTNGNELMSNIPLSSLFAAFSISSLSSFIVKPISVLNVKSRRETFGKKGFLLLNH